MFQYMYVSIDLSYFIGSLSMYVKNKHILV